MDHFLDPTTLSHTMSSIEVPRTLSPWIKSPKEKQIAEVIEDVYAYHGACPAHADIMTWTDRLRKYMHVYFGTQEGPLPIDIQKLEKGDKPDTFVLLFFWEKINAWIPLLYNKKDKAILACLPRQALNFPLPQPPLKAWEWEWKTSEDELVSA
jgi:hypothetical protein